MKPEKLNKPAKNVLPMILVILDGWGMAEPSQGNAITLANTAVMDGLIKKFPNTLINASGKAVGLPPSQSGNSEAGHMNIGAGRIVEQDVVKISKSVNNGTFFKNAGFIEAIRQVKKNKSKLHLMGMISNGMSAHSDPDHLLALLSLVKITKVKEVYLHLFTDGRDSPRYASLKLVEDIQKVFKNGEAIASVVGRYYAMDRKKTWSRTEKAYDALTSGLGRKAASPEAAIMESYNRGESDEFIEPYVITRNGRPLPRIGNGDGVIFFNLRSDRARQFAKVFVQKDFDRLNPGSFLRKKVLKNLLFVAMTDFGPDLDGILTAYPSVDLKQTLPQALKGLSQLYIAESEKYAHVTYFFNGGYADPIAREGRRLVPSPNVRSYDQTPTMSSAELTEAVVNNLTPPHPLLKGEQGGYIGQKKGLDWKYDFTVLNFAAPDMVGHTGNLDAAIKCCHGVDKCLGEIVKAYLNVGGTVLATADHGNIEEMINLKTGEINTEHSTNLVPFVLINKNLGHKVKLRNGGVLGDIAPTILELLNIKKPKEMTGKNLIK
ncbi:phosphoglycerate mutase (2,3-diphosphoglycerate-independent) [Candidatus Falkowbacteria bacterium RIFCSPLOWO2_12_FULL_45_13]|uniref:2,3-bisphosphoglycerate-independent phosphoglycerate mutase n=2 Tax=Candidatus Falkowiibacteriota TaxID=1752728 RepID=A0A1F5SB17_9BACT|nr:MAG: phosphoglycerate mutase (2,3-diphosphoglycerate-independent) [Candidatus Falkowbacteria bacterium RIFCSPLOWO2_02_FULL_45_21]OGF29859.1 MAG: phosphoglycerate mutase (2,3-diphosphoglycerate-independent) [Candidatus Falkowbacteria bacterium RIFCSPLOWO2_12_FULL_45_13]